MDYGKSIKLWRLLVETGKAEIVDVKFAKCKNCGKWSLTQVFRLEDGSEVVVCEKCSFSNKRLKGIF